MTDNRSGSALQACLGSSAQATTPLLQNHYQHAPFLPQAFGSAHSSGSLQQSSSAATSPSAMSGLTPEGTKRLKIQFILDSDATQRETHQTRNCRNSTVTSSTRATNYAKYRPCPIRKSTPYSQYATSVQSSGPAPNPISGPLGPVRPVPLDPEQSTGIPVAKQAYQLMAISSSMGQVQIPVETESASRIRDKHRKQNAQASARFRERRKAKDQETSRKIAVLESLLKSVDEELEWYKKERQELLTALQALPGGERHLSRKKSPRTRRLEAAGPPPLQSTKFPGTYSDPSQWPIEQPHDRDWSQTVPPQNTTLSTDIQIASHYHTWQPHRYQLQQFNVF